MRTETEAEGRLGLAVDVEHVRVFEGVFVAVGRHHHALHERTLGDFYAMEFDVLGRLAHLEGGHRLEARGFVHQLGNQAAVGIDPLQQARRGQQQGHDRAEHARGGFTCRRQQRASKGDDLMVVQRAPLVFGAQ
ncbi:hypothetical protein D3C76_868710 [compost metagenome]